MAITSTATNTVGSSLAVAGGVCVAVSDLAVNVAAQVSSAVPQPGQLTMIGLSISLIGFATAGLPHAYNSLKLMFEDRKDRRAAERAALEHNNRIIELANNLNRTASRLDALEGIEEAARELKHRYEDLEARYLREINEELKPGLKSNTADIKSNAAETRSNTLEIKKNAVGIKTNSAGPSALLDSWQDINPPSQPDDSDPLPHPAFDALPDEPNPLARHSDAPDGRAMSAPSVETTTTSPTRD